MDLISQLPLDIKQRILECLPTRDAARTALFSTHWNDVWLHHGRLVFDSDFFKYFFQEYEGDKSVLNIINNILLHRAGPVKKFTLEINNDMIDPSPEQSDIDRWCLFLSTNGVEELDLSLYYTGMQYKLPDCMLSCRTIKQLKLVGFLFYLPENGGCIFPGITSLVFRNVEFKSSVTGIASSIPNLENLAFEHFCGGIDKFEINAPKLEILSNTCFMRGLPMVESRWFPLHLKTIKTICLSGFYLWGIDVTAHVSKFPTAINLQVLKLYDLSFHCGKQLSIAMKLLQQSPNLCELDIKMATKSVWDDDKEALSRFLEDPNGYFFNQDLKMLNTFKIKSFSGSTLEILFVKMLLSKSPALERVVIHASKEINKSMEVKIRSELLRFPRAFPNAQVVFMDCAGPTCV